MTKTKIISLIVATSTWLIILTSCQLVTKPSAPLTIISIATLQALSTPLTVFEYENQVTDGQILFSIKRDDTVCHKINEKFQIKLVFTNLTGKTIRLPNDFSIAVNRLGDGGNINPFLTTANGTDIYSLADSQFVDIFNTPSSSYYEMQPKQTTDFMVDYSFPEILTQMVAGKIKNYITPTPGQYYIRFVYSEPQRETDTWYGSIGSNRIEICILN